MSQFRVMPSLISIHALHEESDFVDDGLVWGGFIFQSTLSMRRATRWQGMWQYGGMISIHALHEESDMILSARKGVTLGFQSTLSMRRATMQLPKRHSHCIYFNPRSP